MSLERRRRGILVAGALLAAGSAALLVATAEDDASGQRFFGLWRTRHFLAACGLLWLSASCFLAARPRRLALLRFWLATTLCVAGLALAEVLGFLGIVDYDRVFGTHYDALGARAVPNLDLRGETFYDLSRAWRYPSEPVPFHYKTDRYGYRNHIDRESTDIVLLGDSILVAGLLPFEETVTARLEQKLGRSCMSIALIDMSPQEEAIHFRDARLPMRDRLLLHFVFEGNDLLDSADFRANGGAETETPWSQRTLSYLALLALQRSTTSRRPAEHSKIGTIGGERYLFPWTRQSFEGLEGEVTPILDCILGLRDEVAASGGAYGVVLVPSKIRVLGPLCAWPPESSLHDWESHMSPFPAELIRRCAATGIPVLDLTEPLSAAAHAGRIPYFALDSHPNSAGHEIMADAIRKWDLVRASL